MADDSDFSFISVDADDEDDVVIHAGTASVRTEPRKERAVDAGTPAVESDDAQGVSADATEHAVLHDGTLDPEERAEYMRHLARKKAREENRLMTTEEDLHAHVPFAHMQRALIALALILLVVFVAYWFCFHPLG